MSQVVYQGGVGELIEKKSRFIATVEPVTTEEEALEFIASMRKKYWDARHNCYAYIIGEQGQITRCSDDGEPAQTAGRPMLEVLQGREVYNLVVVVTRYFGGVLLGTGGLVRAYQGATKAGLEACVLQTPVRIYPLTIGIDYNGYGKVEYLLRERGFEADDSSFTDQVQLQLRVPVEARDSLAQELADATGGRAQLLWGDEATAFF